MSEDELDKVIWQESHAADERERHIDRLKELTGLDYGDFERELEKKAQYATMLWSSRETAREECNAALERADKAALEIVELREWLSRAVTHLECRKDERQTLKRMLIECLAR